MQQLTIDFLRERLERMKWTLMEYEAVKSERETAVQNAKNLLHYTVQQIETLRAQIAAIEADIGASK